MVWSGQSRSSTMKGGENILCVVASRGDGVVMLSISLGPWRFSLATSPSAYTPSTRQLPDADKHCVYWK